MPTSAKDITVAVVGPTGMLGSALCEALDSAAIYFYPITRLDADITDRRDTIAAVAGSAADLVVNCAAYTDVDMAETRRDHSWRVNADGAGNVAAGAAAIAAPVIHISTDFVFDGKSKAPYTETDPTGPLGWYGKTKLAGEYAVASENARHIILRTSWLFGPGGKNFVDTIKKLAAEREELTVVNDQTGCPTYTVHLAAAIVRIIQKYFDDGLTDHGTYHLTNSGQCTWYQLAAAVLAAHPGKVESFIPITAQQLGRPAPRPARSVLSNDKITKMFAITLPDWKSALDSYFDSFPA